VFVPRQVWSPRQNGDCFGVPLAFYTHAVDFNNCELIPASPRRVLGYKNADAIDRRQRFKPRSKIDAISKHGIIEADVRAHITDNCEASSNSNADLHILMRSSSLDRLLPALRVQLIEAAQNLQRGLARIQSMVGIVNAQYDQHVWYIVAQPVAFVLVLIGGLAETNRAPFDLPEAEQELTGGFHTEYSGMRFALFFLAEYANMIVISSVVTTLFLGGWLPPFPNTPALHFLYYVPSWMWFFLKSFAFLYLFIWVRATLPRYRYDQLMRLGWKVLIPLAIANLIVTGIIKVMLM